MSRSTSWFKSPHFQCGGHGFESRTRYFFGIGYGDGRLCKSLADKFESCISHLFCLRNSVGLEYRAFNTGVASSSLAGGTYFTRLWWNGIIPVSKIVVLSSNLSRRAIFLYGEECKTKHSVKHSPVMVVINRVTSQSNRKLDVWPKQPFPTTLR